MRCRHALRGGLRAFGALGLFITAAIAASTAKKPSVPPGVDPGGVLIALIGEGVDYTRPEIAKRLARDGEGEIIGWDFVDGDRRPYEADTAQQAHLASQEIIGSARIAVFRTKPSDRGSIAKAVDLVAKSPARIVLLASERAGHGQKPPDFELLGAASARFPELLLVAPAGDDKADLDIAEGQNPPNVLIVTAVSGAENERFANQDAKTADIAGPGNTDWKLAGDGEPAGFVGTFTEVAAARITALAARILAAEPSLNAAELKLRIIALAKPFPDGKPKLAVHGLIEDPASQYPVK